MGAVILLGALGAAAALLLPGSAASSGEATTGVTYRAGQFTRRRTLPGRLLWFPFRRERRQSLSFVQAIEPGTMRARVLAKFGRRDCQSYFPPRLSLQLYPR